MFKFILKLAAFLLPLAAFLFFLEYKVYNIPNSYNTKRNAVETKASQIQVLVTGSSQSLYGIDPKYFSVPGYNISNSSQSLYYDKEIVLKEIDKLSNLKCVIIPVSYFSLFYRLEDSEEAWRSFYYCQYWDIANRDLGLFDTRRYSAISLYTPRLSASFFLQRFNVKLIEGLEESGYQVKDSTNLRLRISDTTGLKRVSFHNELIRKGAFSEVTSDFKTLIDKLLARGVQVAIVTPPVFKTYYNYLNKDIDLKNRAFLNSLVDSSRVMFFDYTADNRFVLNDFYDNDHLNFVGAKKFSQIINSEILSKIQYAK